MIGSTCVDCRLPIFRRGMHQSITLSHSLIGARHCLTRSAPARSANDRQLGPEAVDWRQTQKHVPGKVEVVRTWASCR